MGESQTQIHRQAHVVLDIADGNPSAYMAGMNLSAEAGFENLGLIMPIISRVGALAHNRMTRDPLKAEEYVHNSEEKRLSRRARIYAGVAGFRLEWASQCDFCADKEAVNFYQEHPLLGLGAGTSLSNTTERFRLVVSDSLPKLSGIEAVRKHGDRASFAVWNQKAHAALEALGLEAELVAPFILDGLRPDGVDFRIGGDKVVAKASGSGVPEKWWAQLVDGLEFTEGESDWSMHGSKLLVRGDGSAEVNTNRIKRMGDYYNALGARTRVIVTYPNEQLQVGFAMNSRGVPVRLVTWPPRGRHELENFKMGVRSGLIVAQLGVKGVRMQEGVRVVRPQDIVTIARSIPDRAVDLSDIGSDPLFAEDSTVKLSGIARA